MKIKIIILAMIALLFSGCIVGTVAALPFKAVGAVVNVVTPDAVGDSISGVGSVVDAAIPF
jgi:hypothetical protein